MRSQTAYLVVMMCMMAVFAVVRMNPLELQLGPANLAITGALLVGAAATAMQRRYSFLVGMAAAAVTATTGALATAGVRGVRLPGFPALWLVIGVYIAFRLTINLQQTQRAGRSRTDGEGGDGGASGAGRDERSP